MEVPHGGVSEGSHLIELVKVPAEVLVPNLLVSHFLPDQLVIAQLLYAPPLEFELLAEVGAVSVRSHLLGDLSLVFKVLHILAIEFLFILVLHRRL